MNKPGLELLVDLINGANPSLGLTYTGVSIEGVGIQPDPEFNNKSTMGDIIGIPEEGFANMKRLYWNRKKLSLIIGGTPGDSSFTNDGTLTLASTTHEAIPVINALMNGFIVFETKYFHDLPVFESEGGEIAVVLSPTEDSIYWEPGDIGYYTCLVP